MDLSFSPAEETFRVGVKKFIEKEFTADMRDALKKSPTNYLDPQRQRIWQKALYDQGWAAPKWPVEYGGTGWTAAEHYIYETEISKAGAPRPIGFGARMVGPVIIQFGRPDQKERFLPRILAFDDWWCQGYSEPGSGSDLASLSMRAVRDGGHYIVNGSKIWTTLAQHADWIFCLVRTETTQIKQEGISFLLIDMNTPGIEVKPIITVDGSHEVNMVYFDNVEVPSENLVGEEGQGWNIAKFLLAHERSGIAGIAALKRELSRLKDISSEIPLGEGTLLEDPQFRNKIEETEIELTATEFTELRTLAAMSQGGSPGAESSILKIKGTELQQTISELFVEMLAYYGHPFYLEHEIGSNETVGPDYAAPVMPHYLNYRKVSIYGGSNEIQRNVISKAILGL